MTDMLTEALALADRGWQLFPVRPGDKKPLLEGSWRQHSTDDEQTIVGWWTAYPDANIGVDTGKSRLTVIDIDRLDAVAEIETEYGDLPSTLTALTSKGLHLYYTGAPELTNAAARVLPQGVDVRGDGGYVVAPPSTHESGKHYEWSNPGAAVATFPDIIRQAANTPEEPALPATSGDIMADAGEGRVASDWGRAVLAGEVSKVMTALSSDQGGQGRNNQLFTSGLLVFGAVKGGHLERSEADVALQRAALATGLDLKDIAKTMASAWDRADERTPPDRPAPGGDRIAASGPIDGFHGDLTGGDIEYGGNPHLTGGFDLFNLDELAHIPPPKWLLRQRVPEGFSVIFGPPSSGKSFVALDWMLTIASTVDRPVIYFAGEGVAGVKLRVEAWKQANPQFTPTQFHVVPSVPRFMDPAQVAKLKATCAKHEPALVGIDTLARSLVGGDENSATDMGLFVDTFDLMRERHGTSALVVHHTNASATRERGNGALRGACELMWKATRDEHTDEIVLHCDKPPKDGEVPSDSHHILRAVGDSVVLHRPTWQVVSGRPA